MEKEYIQLTNLSVGYHKKVLIHDICLDIRQGEIVTLIGPNGSGKSTILKTITRQLEKIDGRIVFAEKDLHRLSFKELATKIAVVLTERVNPELMTCYDVVATGRYPYTGRMGVLSKEDEAKVYEALRAVHGEELAERPFDAISDGQKQRVLLARAICQEPELIVLDEPTSYLDIKYKLELLSILRRMAKEKNITVIMSLHEIDLAQKISDKVICVKGEVISWYGEPEQIFKDDIIQELYGLDNGYFDTVFGSVELPGAMGKPEVFVLSSCGNGVPVYRRLQKEQIPFATGILYTNDLDYQVAKYLAVEVVTERPFCSISDQSLERALKLMKQCHTIINAGVRIGECNEKMQILLDEATKRE